MCLFVVVVVFAEKNKEIEDQFHLSRFYTSIYSLKTDKYIYLIRVSKSPKLKYRDLKSSNITKFWKQTDIFIEVFLFINMKVPETFECNID